MYEMYLWVVDPRQVAFLCSCKEKLPKETRPGRCAARKERERCPALLANPEREPNSPAAKTSPLGLKHRRAQSTGSGCGARLALRGSNGNSNCNCNRKP